MVLVQAEAEFSASESSMHVGNRKQRWQENGHDYVPSSSFSTFTSRSVPFESPEVVIAISVKAGTAQYRPADSESDESKGFHTLVGWVGVPWLEEAVADSMRALCHDALRDN